MTSVPTTVFEAFAATARDYGDKPFLALLPEPAEALGIEGERLAYYKPPGYVAFVDSLPSTSTRKVQRGELKDLVGRAMKKRKT